jgi:hypothetical protein
VPATGSYGAKTDDVATTAPAADRPAPAVLGSLFDPCTRRFFFRAGLVLTPVSGKEKLGTFGSVSPLAGVALNWATFMPRVRALSMIAHFVPCATATTAFSIVNCAWFPSSDAAPERPSDFERYPAREVHVLGPSTAGGVPPVVRVPFLESGGASPQLAPLPTFGSPAHFAWHAHAKALIGCEDAYPSGLEIYTVYLECVLTSN